MDAHTRTQLERIDRAHRVTLEYASPFVTPALEFRDPVTIPEPVGAVYRRAFPQPDIIRISVPDDEFTGAECDVDALARAARPAAVADQRRPVQPADRARGDRDE